MERRKFVDDVSSLRNEVLPRTDALGNREICVGKKLSTSMALTSHAPAVRMVCAVGREARKEGVLVIVRE